MCDRVLEEFMAREVEEIGDSALSISITGILSILLRWGADAVATCEVSTSFSP